MNEKIKLFILLVVCTVITTCVSTRPGSDNLILDYQQQVIELENRNADLARRLDKYDSEVTASIKRLEVIRRRAASATGTVDEIIGLFAEYQQEVERLLQRYSALKDESGHGN